MMQTKPETNYCILGRTALVTFRKHWWKNVVWLLFLSDAVLESPCTGLTCKMSYQEQQLTWNSSSSSQNSVDISELWFIVAFESESFKSNRDFAVFHRLRYSQCLLLLLHLVQSHTFIFGPQLTFVSCIDLFLLLLLLLFCLVLSNLQPESKTYSIY